MKTHFMMAKFETTVRRTVQRLLSTLVICSLCLTAAIQGWAQQNPQSRLTSTVLFDFENGTFDGWTLTGDCWDKEPATTKTFVDRQGNPLVSGIVGNGYLTTLYKNSMTTGKAVSKEFVIDKPFISFRIGGGHYPKEACLNLVVEGKIVRSETGNNSAELSLAHWDVYALMGKSARLEIVDSSQNMNRGYVMVDDIRQTSYSNVKWPYTSFQRQNTLHFDDLPFDIQPRYDAVVNRIYAELDTPAMRLQPGENIDGIVQRLRNLSNRAAGWAGATDTLTKQLLIAEAVAGWVRHNVQYVLLPQNQRKVGNDPNNIVREKQPKCDCSGFTALTTQLSKALGLSCEHAGGTTRAYGDKVYEKDCHGWVVYTIEDKLIPSDTTNPPLGDDTRYFESGCFQRLYGKTDSHNVLPLRRVEWETFMARHYTHYYGNYQWIEFEPFLNIRWESWRDMDSRDARSLLQTLSVERLRRNKQIATMQ